MAFDSTFDDPFVHIPPSTAAFSDSLVVHEVPHVYEVYEGDHRSRMRERMATRILSWISAPLAPHDPFTRRRPAPDLGARRRAADTG